MKIKLIFILLLNSFACCFAQQINPEHVINLCDSQSIQGTTPQTNQYNNLTTPCSFQPLSSSITLYYVEIESGSTFTFEVAPNAPVDFDFASWKNPNFSNLGVSDRGSQNTIQFGLIYTIGLSMDEPTETCEVGGSSPPLTGAVHGKVRHYDVEPGDGILIAIDHWESSVIGYDLSFGGDAVLNCSIVSKTYTVCDDDLDHFETFDLNEIRNDVNNSTNSFVIDFFENEADANNVNAINSLQSPYNVSTNDSPKTIYARFKRANGLLVRVTEINFIVNKKAISPDYNLELKICTDNLATSGVFDLKRIENEINNINNEQLIYKYYENEADALANDSNFIVDPENYNSISKTIYLQYSINEACFVVIPLKLTIEKPTITVKNLEYSEFCGTEKANALSYNLKNTLPYFLDNQNENDYQISFHNTISDAEQNLNALPNAENYEVNFNTSKLIHVRIMYTEDCYLISTLSLTASKRFKLNDQYNTFCDPFILPEIPDGYRYYSEPNGNGVNYSEGSIIYGKQTIYIYGSESFTTSNTPAVNNCFYELPFTVYNNDCTVPKGISPNGDDLNDSFDLVAFGVTNLQIFNRHGLVVYKHGIGYTNQWHGQSDSGNELPTGTYFYSFESLNGTKTGWVQLIN